LLENIDSRFLAKIYDKTRNNFFDKIMPYITKLGDYGSIWIILSVILLLNRKYRTIGIMCILALVLTSIIGEGFLKHLIQRQRPCNKRSIKGNLIPKPITYSFPSGHTASSFAAAWVISSQIGELLVPVLIIASLIAFSRLYLLLHYPSDIIMGVVLGLICSDVIIRLYSVFGLMMQHHILRI